MVSTVQGPLDVAVLRMPAQQVERRISGEPVDHHQGTLGLFDHRDGDRVAVPGENRRVAGVPAPGMPRGRRAFSVERPLRLFDDESAKSRSTSTAEPCGA